MVSAAASPFVTYTHWMPLQATSCTRTTSGMPLHHLMALAPDYQTISTAKSLAKSCYTDLNNWSNMELVSLEDNVEHPSYHPSQAYWQILQKHFSSLTTYFFLPQTPIILNQANLTHCPADGPQHLVHLHDYFYLRGIHNLRGIQNRGSIRDLTYHRNKCIAQVLRREP